MFCIHCGQEVPEEAKYCPSCGGFLNRPEEVKKSSAPTEGKDDTSKTIVQDQTVINDAGYRPQPDESPYQPVPKIVSADNPSKRKLKAVAVVVIIAIIAIVGLAMLPPASEEDVQAEYHVTIVPRDHIKSCSPSGVYSEKTISIYADPEEGYAFLGWYDENGKLLSSKERYEFMAKDITLYPKAGLISTLAVYKGLGIDDVSGTGSCAVGQTVKLKATMSNGYNFKGWYELGSDAPFSTKTQISYTVTDKFAVIALSDCQVYDGDQILSVEPKYKYDKGTAIWYVYDAWSGNFVKTQNSTSLSLSVSPGVYKVEVYGKVNGKPQSETFEQTVYGAYEREFYWTFKGKNYGMSMTSDFQTIYDLHKNASRTPATDSSRRSYVTYDSDMMVKIAEFMNEQSSSMSVNNRAAFVLDFVQECFHYEYDEDYIGKSEYWKYPIETLYGVRGDCEDTSILLASILKAMGYDVALLFYSSNDYEVGHMAVGVALTDMSGSYYEVDGKHYFYCETTAEGYNIGKIPDDYGKARVIVI